MLTRRCLLRNLGEDTIVLHLEAIVKAVGADLDLIKTEVMVVVQEAVDNNSGRRMVKEGDTIQEAISEIDWLEVGVRLVAVT